MKDFNCWVGLNQTTTIQLVGFFFKKVSKRMFLNLKTKQKLNYTFMYIS